MSDLKARLEGLQHVWRQMAIQARKTERQGNAQQYMWACVEGAKAQILDQCADRLAALLVGEEPPADQDWCPIATAPNELVLLYRPRLPERDRISIRRRSDWCGPLC